MSWYWQLVLSHPIIYISLHVLLGQELDAFLAVLLRRIFILLRMGRGVGSGTTSVGIR